MMKVNLISHALFAIAIVLCSESSHALSKNSVSAFPFLKTESRSLRRKETDDMEQRNADNDPPGFESDDASTDGADDTNDTGGNGGTVNDDVTDDNGETNDTGGNEGTVNDDVTDDNGETNDSTDDPCQLENGSLGDATGTSTEISYSYEIITVGDLTPDILNGLESSISESIASDLWDCSRRRVLRNGLRKRKLEITGLSAQPADVVTEIQCATAVEGDEQCSVVDGRLTIYGTEDEDGQILAVIEKGMSENGTLADSSEVIKRLVYIPPSDETIVVVTEEENFNNNDFKKASGGGDSNVIAIASGACALVIIGFVAGRRLYKKNSTDSSSDSSSSDGEEISEGFQDISEAEDINNSNVIAAGVLNSSGSVTVSSSFAT